MAGYSRFGFICYHYIVSNLAADFVVTICMVHNSKLECTDKRFLRKIRVSDHKRRGRFCFLQEDEKVNFI